MRVVLNYWVPVLGVNESLKLRTPLIVARAGYFRTISWTGVSIVRISFLLNPYVDAIKVLILFLSCIVADFCILQCRQMIFLYSVSCVFWIRNFIPEVYSPWPLDANESLLAWLLFIWCSWLHTAGPSFLVLILPDMFESIFDRFCPRSLIYNKHKNYKCKFHVACIYITYNCNLPTHCRLDPLSVDI